MIVFRYLSRQLLQAMAAVTLVLLVVALTGRFIQYLGQAVAGELATDALFLLIIFRLPDFLLVIVPLAFFLSILLVYGRMYAENEMVVLIASGVISEEIVVAVVGIPLLILGLVFVAISGRVSEAFLVATVEGEAYKATAKMAEYAQELDVVADVRLTVQARIGVFREGTEMKESPDDVDTAALGNDFRELCDKVVTVLPKFMIR